MDTFIKGELRYLHNSEDDIGKKNGVPVIVASSVIVNDLCERIIIAPLAAVETKQLPTHIQVKIGKISGYIISERLQNVPKCLLGAREGILSDKDITEFDKRLGFVLEGQKTISSELLKRIEKEYRKSDKKEEIERQKDIKKAAAEEAGRLTHEYSEKEQEYVKRIDALEKIIEDDEMLKSINKELEDSIEEKNIQIQKNEEKYRAILSSYDERIKDLENSLSCITKEKEKLEKSSFANVKNYGEKDKLITEYKSVIEEDKKRIKKLQGEIARINAEKERVIIDSNETIGKYRATLNTNLNEINRLKEEMEDMYTQEYVDELRAKQSSGSVSTDVDLQVAIMERDMYKNKYMEALRNGKI